MTIDNSNIIRIRIIISIIIIIIGIVLVNALVNVLVCVRAVSVMPTVGSISNCGTFHVHGIYLACVCIKSKKNKAFYVHYDRVFSNTIVIYYENSHLLIQNG